MVAQQRREDRLHPAAWWLWALGLATAATRTSNPWLLLLIVGVAGCVVVMRRGDEPWATAYGVFFRFGLIVIAIRVLFHILLGGAQGATILFTTPSVPLPDWMAGIRLGGPVSAEGILAAVYDGLGLATLLCCVGAANALANPKRLLRAMPAALYEISVAIVVALSVAPQLVASARQAYRARALRGDANRGVRAVRTVVAPVLTDALERSISLAAAMDSRGYGRLGDIRPAARRGTAALMLGGLIAICVGVYQLLDRTARPSIALVVLCGGLGLAVVGLWMGGRRVPRTRYRPDRWGIRDAMVAASGVVALAVMMFAQWRGVGELTPQTAPLTAPGLPLLPTLGVLAALLPTWIAPAPPLPTPQGATA